MSDATHLDATRRNYDAMAVRYAEFVEEHSNADPFGPAMISAFADLVASGSGNAVLDAGCGPGHITDILDQRGLALRGVDLSPTMIDLARDRRPDLVFEVGSILDLDAGDGAFDGVLAHFSVIHTPPDQVPSAIAECARVLRPGGHLLLAFQSGDDALQAWEAFDHKVSPAYRWRIDALAELMQGVDLAEVARLRVQPGALRRFQEGYLLAQKASVAD